MAVTTKDHPPGSAAPALQAILLDPPVATYAVLDGASVPGLLAKLAELSPEHCCLFRGELEPDLAEAAPYLVTLLPEHAFTDWLFRNGWAKHWGVFAQSHADFRAMRKHFRTFFIVSGVNGKPAFFRYYDPRVLRVYLPSCTPDELDTVFGPIIHYLVESETGDAVLRFHAANGALIRESLALANA